MTPDESTALLAAFATVKWEDEKLSIVLDLLIKSFITLDTATTALTTRVTAAETAATALTARVHTLDGL